MHAHETEGRDVRFDAAAESTGAAVLARGLSKFYRGHWSLRSVPGLVDLNLEIQAGEVVGLLGSNGAGKTTTLKLLTGLLKPTRGEAWLFGRPIAFADSRRQLGFLPEQPYFYDYLNGVEYLELAGRLSGLSANEAKGRAREWMGRVGLGDRPRLVLRKYSKGMLQRLGLAAALVHGPRLLILDEPMSGLDPFGRRDIRELILEQRSCGVTILFSSHILPDVEMLCDRVVVLRHGRLALTTTIHEVMEHAAHGMEVRCIGSPLLEFPPAWRGRVRRTEHPDGTALLLDDTRLLDELLPWLIARGVRVRAVTPQRASLEDLLLDGSESKAPQRQALS
jgi:ABC-2 type transport system ATP-binding protein